MFRTPVVIIAIATATLAAAAVPGAALAQTSSAETQEREVCAQSTYVTERPDAIPLATLTAGEKVDVSRYSPSGGWAYGKPRGTMHEHLGAGGWVKVADLCAMTSSTTTATTTAKRYSVRIAPGQASTGPVYVGFISNITVKDTQRAGQRLRLCITPAPTERPSCRGGRTGRTIDTIAWSQAGPTKVRIAIEGGPVIVKIVNVRRAKR